MLAGAAKPQKISRLKGEAAIDAERDEATDAERRLRELRRFEQALTERN